MAAAAHNVVGMEVVDGEVNVIDRVDGGEGGGGCR